MVRLTGVHSVSDRAAAVRWYGLLIAAGSCWGQPWPTARHPRGQYRTSCSNLIVVAVLSALLAPGFSTFSSIGTTTDAAVQVFAIWKRPCHPRRAIARAGDRAVLRTAGCRVCRRWTSWRQRGHRPGIGGGGTLHQEAFGTPRTCHGRLYIDRITAPHPEASSISIPTFLYESLWNLLSSVASGLFSGAMADRLGALTLAYTACIAWPVLREGLRIDA